MKTRTPVITYLATLVVGLLLLIYGRGADVFKWIVVVIGILFMVPSVIAAIGLLFPSGNKEEKAVTRVASVALWATSIGGLIFGILLVCMPGFFVDYLVYTFGVILILCGISSIMMLSIAARPFGIAGSYLVVPILTIVAGVVVILLGPERIQYALTLVTGIVLIFFSVNGLLTTMLQKRKTASANKEL